MPFSVVCPHCQKRYTAPDSLAGRTLSCPQCRGQFQASPAPRPVLSAAEQELQQDADAGQYSLEDAPVAPAPERKGPVCPACGKSVPGGSRICISCGQDLHSPVAPRADDPAGLTGGEMSALMGSSSVAVARPSVLGPVSVGAASLIASLLAYVLHAGSALEVAAIFFAFIGLALGILCLILLVRLGERALAAAGAAASLLALLFLIIPLVSLILNAAGSSSSKPGNAGPAPDHVALNPVDRDLELLTSATGADRLDAAQRLVEDAPAERYPEIAAAFEKRLHDPEAPMRRWAIKGVAFNADPRINDLFITAVNDVDPSVRAAAMDQLGARRDARAVDPIMAHLATDFEPACNALKAIGAPAQKPLISLLADPDPAKRILGARALAKAGTPDAVPLLRRLSKDSDPEVARAAKAAWRALAPDEFDKFAEVLANLGEPSRRVQSLAILTVLIPPPPEDPRREEIATTLAQQLISLDTAYAPEYGHALALWQTPSTGTLLLDALQATPPPPPQRRRNLLIALGYLRLPAAAPVLAAALSTDSTIATPGLLALGPAAQDALIPLLAGDNPQTLWDTCVILRQIGTPDKAAPALAAFAAATKNPALAAVAKDAAAVLQPPAPPTN